LCKYKVIAKEDIFIIIYLILEKNGY